MQSLTAHSKTLRVDEIFQYCLCNFNNSTSMLSGTVRSSTAGTKSNVCHQIQAHFLPETSEELKISVTLYCQPHQGRVSQMQAMLSTCSQHFIHFNEVTQVLSRNSAQSLRGIRSGSPLALNRLPVVRDGAPKASTPTSAAPLCLRPTALKPFCHTSLFLQRTVRSYKEGKLNSTLSVLFRVHRFDGTERKKEILPNARFGKYLQSIHRSPSQPS